MEAHTLKPNHLAEIVSLFAYAPLLALVRSAGRCGALSVSEAANVGNVPLTLPLRIAPATCIEEATPQSTVVPVRSDDNKPLRRANLSARSWGHSKQELLPETIEYTISHYDTLDASKVTVLDQCPPQTVVPEDFVCSTARLTHFSFSSTCDGSYACPLSTITRIEGGFLLGMNSLRSMNVAALCGVTSIGSGFLRSCYSLKHVDLSPFSNVTSVESDFIYECVALRKLDVSPLSKITAFEDGFLGGCIELEEVNLEAIVGVTRVGDLFMDGCKKLRRLSLAPMSNITAVGDQFLNKCSCLEDVDLSPLANVTSLGPTSWRGAPPRARPPNNPPSCVRLPFIAVVAPPNNPARWCFSLWVLVNMLSSDFLTSKNIVEYMPTV